MSSRIHIEHTFEGITVPEFWDMLLDPAFDVALQPALGVKLRTILDRQDTPETLKRKVRVVPGFPLPAPVQKVMGGRELEYLEESTFHKARKVLDWKATPGMMADKVRVGGTVQATAVGANSVRRVIEGEVSIDVFGLGGLMEKGVIESVKNSYEKASNMTREWIRAGKHKQKANA